MKAHFFHAFVCLVFIFSILFIGFVLVLLPIAPHWVHFLITKLKTNPAYFANIGKVVMGVGALLLFLFYFANRKTFYNVLLEPSLSYTITNKMVDRLVSDYMKEQSASSYPYKLNIYGQNIELIADLSEKPLEEHSIILEGLEQKLGKLIEKQIGLPNKFTVSVLVEKA